MYGWNNVPDCHWKELEFVDEITGASAELARLYPFVKF